MLAESLIHRWSRLTLAQLSAWFWPFSRAKWRFSDVTLWSPVRIVVCHRRVLSRLKLNERRKEDLLWELQVDISVLAFPAGKDADVGDDQRLSSACLDELLLAWHLTANWRHRPIGGELTVGGRLIRSRAHPLIGREGPAKLRTDTCCSIDELTIWQPD